MYNNFRKNHFSFLILFCLICGLVSCDAIIEEEITDPVLLVSPPNKSISDLENIQFSWTPEDKADYYILEIVNPSFDSAYTIQQRDSFSTTSTPITLPEGSYEWRVIVANFGYQSISEAFNITIVTDSLLDSKQVAILSPTNNITTNENPVFLWNTMTAAADYRFELYSGNSFSTASNLMKDTITQDTTYQIALTDGTHVWRVRGQNEFGLSSFVVQNITIDKTPPSIPTLSSPTDNTDFSISALETPFDLVWSSANDASVDSLYLYKDALTATPSIFAIDSSSIAIDDALIAIGTYYWSVKSQDAIGNTSIFSDTLQYTISQ